VDTRKAKYLDLILYSREQLVKEHDAMPGKGPSESLPEAPWGIISVKPQVSTTNSIVPVTLMMPIVLFLVFHLQLRTPHPGSLPCTMICKAVLCARSPEEAGAKIAGSTARRFLKPV